MQGHTLWRQSKARVRFYIAVNSNFRSIFNRFVDIAGFILIDLLTLLANCLALGHCDYGAKRIA